MFAYTANGWFAPHGPALSGLYGYAFVNGWSCGRWEATGATGQGHSRPVFQRLQSAQADGGANESLSLPPAADVRIGDAYDAALQLLALAGRPCNQLAISRHGSACSDSASVATPAASCVTPAASGVTPTASGATAATDLACGAPQLDCPPAQSVETAASPTTTATARRRRYGRANRTNKACVAGSRQLFAGRSVEYVRDFLRRVQTELHHPRGAAFFAVVCGLARRKEELAGEVPEISNRVRALLRVSRTNAKMVMRKLASALLVGCGSRHAKRRFLSETLGLPKVSILEKNWTLSDTFSILQAIVVCAPDLARIPEFLRVRAPSGAVETVTLMNCTV
jgi:hypothetical protein